MSKLPAISGRDAIKVFEKVGFQVVRIKGSHHIMKKPDYIHLLTVPVHPGKTLKKGLLHNLIQTAGMTEEEFLQFL